MRFYIPGTTTKKEAMEDGEANSDAENDEEQNAATLFYDTLMEKAEIGEVAGDTFATFLDVLHLTPRYALLIPDCVRNANLSTEDGSILTCTRIHSGYEARRTTTRFNMRPSRSS